MLEMRKLSPGSNIVSKLYKGCHWKQSTSTNNNKEDIQEEPQSQNIAYQKGKANKP